MGEAFQCDRCDELCEGKPEKYKAYEYGTDTGTGRWKKWREMGDAELCEGCGKEFREYVAVLLGDEDRYLMALDRDGSDE